MADNDTASDDPHGTMEAWGIIANAFGGNWNLASPEWREAAERWRDRWLHHKGPRLSLGEVAPGLVEGLQHLVDEYGQKGVENVLAQWPLWHHTPDAPWRDGPLPEMRLAARAELHIAGALSTMPPFDKYHLAVMALKALGNLDLED